MRTEVLCNALVATCVLACGSPGAAPPSPRLVLLYATCTLNASYLEPYADHVRYTPELAAFAAGSLVFERHHTEAGQSGIAYASILSGTHADRHGVYRHPALLDESLVLLPEIFAAAGYTNFHWSGHKMAHPDLQYDQGSCWSITEESIHSARSGDDVGGRVPACAADLIDGRPSPRSAALRPDDPLFRAILSGLRRDPAQRAFVLTTFTQTHGPYRLGALADFLTLHPEAATGLSHAEIRRYHEIYSQNFFALSWNHDAAIERLDLAPGEQQKLAAVIELVYEANVHALDASFGRLLAEIEEAGLRDDSLIVFTADHGEILWRETADLAWTHGMQLAPEVLRVPLIVRHRSLAPGRYQGISRSIDLLPTIAGLSRLALPGSVTGSLAGVDLSSAMRGEAAEPPLEAFFHTSLVPRSVRDLMRRKPENWETLRRLHPVDDPTSIWVGARRGDAYYLHRPAPEGAWRTQRFELGLDPELARDRFDASDPEDRRIQEELLLYKQRLVQAHPAHAAGLTADQEYERLKALGYVE